MALPKSIKVGEITYKVEVVEDLRDDDDTKLWGCVVWKDCLIQISAKLAPAMQYRALWHEIVHIVMGNMGLKEHDEQLVDALAVQLAGVMALNGAKILP
jgi:hypothetical protein